MTISFELGDKVKMKNPTTEYMASREYVVTKVLGANLYNVRIKRGRKEILVHRDDISPLEC